jgi:hypothetical protein
MALIRRSVPVVAGTVQKQESCAACGSDDSARSTVSVDGIYMVLCNVSCASIYRRGATPAEYARSLAAQS